MSRKKHISAFLVKTVQFIKRIDERFTQNAFNPNPKQFEDLTPVYQEEEDKTYTDTLLWALRNPEVKNIAITGPYGSGKSSILKTFEHDHKEFKFLKISLGSFEEEFENTVDQDTSTTEEDAAKTGIKKIDKADRKRIETSILQQIFYKVKSKQVPFSRFRRIRNTPFWLFLLRAAALIIWAITGAYIFKPDFYNRLSYWKEFNKSHGDLFLYMTTTLFVLITGTMLVKIFKTYNSTRFHKLNISNGELELAQETDSSILNKHLDEILYFFEETNYDVVIIEDLDRFKDPEIFTKLRELNNLINSSSQVDRCVRFVYALKDDIFKEGNRTKFFDFLLPVIPVINSSNSGEKLIKKFDDAGMKGRISNTFLTDITIFIEDMRMLKNIYNEYVIYKTKIGLDLDQERLLGLIVYKNFYPTDFADLNINKGIVFECFAHKEKAVLDLENENLEAIEGFKERIAQLESDVIKNSQELRSVYLMALIQKIPEAYRFVVNNNSWTLADLMIEDNFSLLSSSRNFQYQRYNYGSNQNPGFTFKSIEKEVDPVYSYEERENTAKLKLEGEIEKLRIQIGRLSDQNNKMQGWSLKVFAAQRPEKGMSPEVDKEKLLSYLLRRGFIDEMYHAYISFFYEGTITRTDMDFVISVKNLGKLPFTFKLTKTDQVLKRFQLSEYGQVEMLNYDMLDHLARNNRTMVKELELFIKQLTNTQQPSLDFIDGYLKEGKMLPVVFKLLCKEWPGIWEFVDGNPLFDNNKKDEYLRVMISYADTKDIKKTDSKNSLRNYISSKDDFLTLLPKVENQKMKDLMDGLLVEFKSLIYNEEVKELFEFVYRKSHYELNSTMILLMLKQYGFADSLLEEKFQKANFTTINSSGCEPLINYVNANLDVYFKDVYIELPLNVENSEADLLKFILDEKLTDENRKEIISKDDNLFLDLSDLPPSLWSHSVGQIKIWPDWSNVRLYFQDENMSPDILSRYLDHARIYSYLSTDPIGETDGDDQPVVDKLTRFILENNKLSDKAYQALVASSPWIYGDLDLRKLSPAKVQILLEKETISFTKTNYDKLRAHFFGKHILLLENNYNSYLKKVDEMGFDTGDDIVFDTKDYELIFGANKITMDQKKQLILDIDTSVITTKKLSELICLVIFEKLMVIEYPLFNELIKHSANITFGINLFNLQFNRLNTSSIQATLLALGGEFADITHKGLRPKVEYNTANEVLIQKLKDVGYISTFKIDGDKIIVNTKRK